MNQFRSLAAFLLLPAINASAHFAWIIPSDNGATAQVVMSETLAPDDEGVKIDILAGAKLVSRDLVTGDVKPFELTDKAGNAFVVPLTSVGDRVLHGVADLGVNQRGSAPPNVLIYYPKTIIGDPFDAKATLGSTVAPIELIPVHTEKGFKLQLLVEGKPAPAGEKLHVILPDKTQDQFAIDANGMTDEFPAPGRYGVWGRHFIDSAGSRDGQDYKQIREYATLVINVGGDDSTKMPSSVNATKTAATKPSDAKPFARMVEKAASFGAVASDGYLYIYGGHTADRHNYSTTSVSGKFNRLKLSDPTKWEALPGGPPLQGMNLATLDSEVYRVGGMQPQNADGEPEDNRSIADVVRYDPKRNRWDQLPNLRVARSSHDIAFIGHKLFVVGGWCMNGKDQPSTWIKDMQMLNLNEPVLGWKTLEQPFSRRALIVAVHHDKLFVMGGFDEDDEPHLDVDVYDPASDKWSKAADIPGEKINGFSPAACDVNGKLVMSVGTGDLYELSDDDKTWNLVAHNSPRMVHRLVPFDSQALIIGGAMEAKMTDLIETIDLSSNTTATTAK